MECKHSQEWMSAYLDAMDSAGYEGPRPAEPPPRVLAALRPRMLELAGQPNQQTGRAWR